MNGLALSQAMAGVGEGITEGLKIADSRKAQMLNSMLVQQSIEKNTLVMQQAREEAQKKLAAEQMKGMATEAGLTGDLSKFNQYLNSIKSPWHFSDRASSDGTVDILDQTGQVLQNGASLNKVLNSMYHPVVGEEYPDYADEKKKEAEEFKANKAKVIEEERRRTKAMAPGESASTKAKNLSAADKNTAAAERDRVVTDVIKKTGAYPASGEKKPAKAPPRRLGIKW